ncbi:MAG: hypothetical protein AAGG72_01815 [Pseudomonadota bacterium]
MSTLRDRELALAAQFRDDLEVYARACLKIRTKDTGLVPFELNAAQRLLQDKLDDQKQRTGKVRALVLKGRQMGISTYVGGRYYHRTTHARGWRTFILTHHMDSTNALFEMTRRYHKSCPEMFQPSTRAANAKELIFDKLDSSYTVSTAGSQEIGRGETLQMLHGSEVAFWPKAEDHFAGLMQALSSADGTEAILESTANGIGNTFHRLCMAARAGDSDFELIFLPWYIHEEYQTPVDGSFNSSPEWEEYQQTYDLTREQLHWAWRKNRDMATVQGFDIDSPCNKFRQEYPANVDEAFQVSGEGSFISPDKVAKARKAKGVDAYGPLILGIDPARGGTDDTGLIDRQGRVMGAHVCERWKISDLMVLSGKIVRLVNDDLRPKGLRKVVVDMTGLGAGLYDRLSEQLGDMVVGVNFAERAYEPDRFANRRVEMWDGLRKWFDEPGGVRLPDDDLLQGDLCAPIWGGASETHFDSSGRLRLESKDNIRKRIGGSPDMGDAAALTFAADFSYLDRPARSRRPRNTVTMS